jgi:hypothetical protein
MRTQSLQIEIAVVVNRVLCELAGCAAHETVCTELRLELAGTGRV